VRMETRGTEEEIDRVILMIEQGSYVRIESMDVRTVPTEPDEHGFRIR